MSNIVGGVSFMCAFLLLSGVTLCPAANPAPVAKLVQAVHCASEYHLADAWAEAVTRALNFMVGLLEPLRTCDDSWGLYERKWKRKHPGMYVL